jgi:glycosyltransferase involved in cell wall biosynthesis
MIIGVDASRAGKEAKTGTENYSAELIRALLDLPESARYKWRLYDGMTRMDLVSKQGATFIDTVKIPWKRFWTQGGLALELWKNPPDVLWVPAHTLPVLRPKKIKTVVTIHGLEYEYLPEYYQFPQKLYLNKSTEYAVKHADRLIAVSNWTKNQLVNRLGADPEKITVIYEGINHKIASFQLPMSKKYLRQIRHKYNLPQDYILFVGTVQPRKNLVRLIQALPAGENLVIAGKLGWLYESILAAAKNNSRVRLIGRVADADLPAVYKMAKLFVWPSLIEGFGLPILEAMSLGVPVIAANRGALPEVAGKAALLVDPESVKEINQAINLVLANQALREGLVEAGLRQAGRFSWQKAADLTLKVLTEKW